MIEIAQVLRNGNAFDFKNRGKAVAMNLDSMMSSVASFFQLLEVRRIDSVLVGGVAMLQYIDGCNTQEIDLVIALPAHKKLPEIHLISQDADFARGDFHGLQIDFLLTRNTLFRMVQKNYSTFSPFAERSIKTATVEGLLLLKLYALPSLYRQGNFGRVTIYEGDIAALIQKYRPDMKPIWLELAKHMGETDLKSLQDVAEEIESRIHRFDAFG